MYFETSKRLVLNSKPFRGQRYVHTCNILRMLLDVIYIRVSCRPEFTRRTDAISWLLIVATMSNEVTNLRRSITTLAAAIKVDVELVRLACVCAVLVANQVVFNNIRVRFFRLRESSITRLISLFHCFMRAPKGINADLFVFSAETVEGDIPKLSVSNQPRYKESTGCTSTQNSICGRNLAQSIALYVGLTQMLHYFSILEDFCRSPKIRWRTCKAYSPPREITLRSCEAVVLNVVDVLLSRSPTNGCSFDSVPS